MLLIVAAAVFAALGLLLLLHHGWKHAREDPATSLAQRESCWQVCYFQRSDVNFRSCNHEMWILLFFFLALLCLLFSFLDDTAIIH